MRKSLSHFLQGNHKNISINSSFIIYDAMNLIFIDRSGKNKILEGFKDFYIFSVLLFPIRNPSEIVSSFFEG